MYVTFRRGENIGPTTMAFLFLIFTLFTLIDAQEDQQSVSDSNLIPVMGTKRAGFLPSRGRRFWSVFNWDDSGEKRARFLPMRGRKAGFLPMRGKKWFSNDDYIDVYPMLNSDSDVVLNDSLDLEKRSAFMPMRGKKELSPLRGKNSQSFDSIYNLDKKSRNFFGMRG